MKTPVEIVETLKDQIELNQFGFIYGLMKRRSNYHFFADKVKKPKNGYFDFSKHTAIWSNEFKVTPDKDRDDNDIFEVTIDLELSGKICEHNDKGFTFFENSITLNLGIRAYTTTDGWTSIDHINLMNSEQKALTDFHGEYIKELRRSGLKTIAETEYHGVEAFSFFTRVWKNVDNSNHKMVEGTSLDFFNEFVEAHRNVIFQVSCANMWGRYISHYTDDAYSFESRKVYPRNPTFYDTRYTIFLETAMEDLYSFYERCAYFTFLFLQPNFLRPKDVSFARLFDKRTTKALKKLRPELSINPHWKWFSSRVANEHKILSGFRHPLIHYQDVNTFIRGSYSAAQSRLWLSNAYDDAKGLEDLEHRMNDILKFLNAELPKCHVAFINVVQLCESLEALSVQKSGLFSRLIKALRGYVASMGRKMIKLANEHGN